MATATDSIHPFEAAGLGLSPFVLTGFSEKIYSACPGHSQPGGTCDFCGTGIRYCCHIRSHDGKHFIVGTDCVAKLGRSDNRLVKSVERKVLELKRQQREEKRRAEWDRRQAATTALLQSQRERNGGLTDYEVKKQAERAAEDAKAADVCSRNEWLLSILRDVPYGSDFVTNMTIELSTRSLAHELSPRMREVLRDIYAKTKTGARRNSKKYDAAAEEFESKIETAANPC